MSLCLCSRGRFIGRLASLPKNLRSLPSLPSTLTTGASGGYEFGTDRRSRRFSSVYRNYGDDDDEESDDRDGIGNDPDDDFPRKRTALVLGSSGSVGRAVSRHLSTDLGMRVVGADVAELPDDADWGIEDFCTMPTNSKQAPPPLAAITTSLTMGMMDIMGPRGKIDAIICATGGFESDPEFSLPGSDDDAVVACAQEYGESIDRMFHRNLYPVLAAGYIANRFMANEGLFVVMGAAAALSSTPGMMGYGISKAGTHHFVQSLGETTGLASTTPTKRKSVKRLRKHSEYLDTLSVVGLLPNLVDKTANRKAMPDADFTKWTDPNDIAHQIGDWIKTPSLRPHSGSLVKVTSAKGRKSQFVLVR